MMIYGLSELIATQCSLTMEQIIEIIKGIEVEIESVNRVAEGERSQYEKTETATPNVNSFFSSEPELPPSWAKDRDPYRLPIKECRILGLYDLHMPFHARDEIKIAIDYGVSVRSDVVIIAGDGMDCISMSRFPKIHRNLQVEIDVAINFLHYLRFKFPVAKIIWLEGNHEEHIKRFLMTKAAELHDLRNMKFENLLHFDDFGVEFVENKRIIEVGDANLIHGHEVLGGGENVARNKMKRAMTNLIFGHSHLKQEHIVKTLKNKILGAWSIGPLCHPSPDYNPYNNWILGFLDLMLHGDGKFTVNSKSIINGRVF